MTFRRNNVGLESLGFFPCMAQVQPMPNKELIPDLNHRAIEMPKLPREVIVDNNESIAKILYRLCDKS